MMRVGELWALKWGDIESIQSLISADGRETSLVTINVRAETAKNRRSRTVISRGGEYVLRLKERTTHTGADDFVFASIGGKAQLTRQKYYLHWKCLMDGIGIDHKKLTYRYQGRDFRLTDVHGHVVNGIMT